MTAVEPDILAGYQLRLPSFEGPLDVLLRLIERHQLAIADVSLVAVTDQFLAYLDELEAAPAATVAEFAAMGARLVLIKSRSLLPRPAVADEGEPEELVRQLIEYRSVQAAALGCSARACWLIAHHEERPLPDDRELRLLVEADRACP